MKFDIKALSTGCIELHTQIFEDFGSLYFRITGFQNVAAKFDVLNGNFLQKCTYENVLCMQKF